METNGVEKKLKWAPEIFGSSCGLLMQSVLKTRSQENKLTDQQLAPLGWHRVIRPTLFYGGPAWEKY